MWKFKPILVATIWGDDRIERLKRITPARGGVGESWEISGIAGRESVVAGGPDDGLTITQLIARDKGKLLGNRNYERFGAEMPLLIKLIDAGADLSVQVHPDSATAQKLGLGRGKTEMWYVVSAGSDALIANGFREPVDPDRFTELAKSGAIVDKLNFTKARCGDAHLIPAGRVHAICKGTFLIEIQQPSDLTFRIYDYDRRDSDGNPRALHIDHAREALNFSEPASPAPIKYTRHRNIPVNLVDTSFFTVNVLDLDREIRRNYSELDSFVAIVGVKGSATLTTHDRQMRIAAGETVLISADEDSVEITPHSGSGFRAVETFIR